MALRPFSKGFEYFRTMRTLSKIVIGVVVLVAYVAWLVLWLAIVDTEIPRSIATHSVIVWVLWFSLDEWSWRKPKKKKKKCKEKQKPQTVDLPTVKKELDRVARIQRMSTTDRLIPIFKDSEKDKEEEAHLADVLRKIKARENHFHFILVPYDCGSLDSRAFEMITELYKNGYDFIGEHRIGNDSIHKFSKNYTWSDPNPAPTKTEDQKHVENPMD